MRGAARPIRDLWGHPRPWWGTGSGIAFAVKVIGVGVFAGLMLAYCNALLDACMSGIH